MDDDIKALREAIADHKRVMTEEGQLLVPYEEYRAAIDGYAAAAEPDRIARLLARLEAAERAVEIGAAELRKISQGLLAEAEQYLQAAADGSMSRNNSENLAAELLAQIEAP